MFKEKVIYQYSCSHCGAIWKSLLRSPVKGSGIRCMGCGANGVIESIADDWVK